MPQRTKNGTWNRVIRTEQIFMQKRKPKKALNKETSEEMLDHYQSPNGRSNDQ